jgi:hypothetical protein
MLHSNSSSYSEQGVQDWRAGTSGFALIGRPPLPIFWSYEGSKSEHNCRGIRSAGCFPVVSCWAVVIYIGYDQRPVFWQVRDIAEGRMIRQKIGVTPFLPALFQQAARGRTRNRRAWRHQVGHCQQAVPVCFESSWRNRWRVLRWSSGHVGGIWRWRQTISFTNLYDWRRVFPATVRRKSFSSKEK